MGLSLLFRLEHCFTGYQGDHLFHTFNCLLNVLSFLLFPFRASVEANNGHPIPFSLWLLFSHISQILETSLELMHFPPVLYHSNLPLGKILTIALFSITFHGLFALQLSSDLELPGPTEGE